MPLELILKLNEAIRKCRRCEASIIRTDPRTIYCSYECQYRYRNEQVREKRQRLILMKRCLHCRKRFKPKDHRPIKYCSQKCRKVSEPNRTSKQAYYRANKEKIRRRVQAYYKANREKAKARVLAYKKAHPERQWFKRYPAKAKAKVQAYYKTNRERLLEEKRARRKANPEPDRAYYKANSKKINAKAKEWAQKNREKVSASSRKSYWKNPHRSRETSRSWQKRNPERVAKNRREYRAANLEKIRERNRKNFKYSVAFRQTKFGAAFVAAKRAVLDAVQILKNKRKGKTQK